MPEIGEIRMGREIGKNIRIRHIWHACLDCGTQQWVTCVRGKARSNRCQSCANSGKKGEKSHRWKGGRIKTREGYIKVLLFPNDFFYSMAEKSGYVSEHRLVMGKKLGRPLQPWELVHHKDGIKDHNTDDNLEMTTKESHVFETKNSVAAAYKQGFQDGAKIRDDELRKEIKLLQWQVKELIGEHRLFFCEQELEALNE